VTDSESFDRPSLWDISQIGCDGTWYLKPIGYIGPFNQQISYLNTSYSPLFETETSEHFVIPVRDQLSLIDFPSSIVFSISNDPINGIRFLTRDIIIQSRFGLPVTIDIPPGPNQSRFVTEFGKYYSNPIDALTDYETAVDISFINSNSLTGNTTYRLTIKKATVIPDDLLGLTGLKLRATTISPTPSVLSSFPVLYDFIVTKGTPNLTPIDISSDDITRNIILYRHGYSDNIIIDISHVNNIDIISNATENDIYRNVNFAIANNSLANANLNANFFNYVFDPSPALPPNDGFTQINLRAFFTETRNYNANIVDISRTFLGRRNKPDSVIIKPTVTNIPGATFNFPVNFGDVSFAIRNSQYRFVSHPREEETLTFIADTSFSYIMISAENYPVIDFA
jgi:hypothetical protein